MDKNEEFIFGDASDIDPDDCEEILISESTVTQSKKAPIKTSAVDNTKITQLPQQPPPVNISTVSADPDRIYSVQQAADYMQISSFTIRRRILSGELGAFKVGRMWRIKQSQIDIYLHSNMSSTVRL